MEKRVTTLRALALGAVVGVVVLGWAGRIATIALAWFLGLSANPSVAGFVEATIVGAIGGAAGALILLALRGMGTPGVLRGVATGAVLFALSAALAWVRGRLVTDAAAVQAVTLVVTAVVFVLYGVALDFALDGRRRRNTPTRT